MPSVPDILPTFGTRDITAVAAFETDSVGFNDRARAVLMARNIRNLNHLLNIVQRKLDMFDTEFADEITKSTASLEKASAWVGELSSRVNWSLCQTPESDLWCSSGIRLVRRFRRTLERFHRRANAALVIDAVRIGEPVADVDECLRRAAQMAHRLGVRLARFVSWSEQAMTANRQRLVDYGIDPCIVFSESTS